MGDTNYRTILESSLTPDMLAAELREYQKNPAIGFKFTIQDLLHLYDIRANMLLAEAIANAKNNTQN